MATIFANNMQWSSENLNSHTIANSKFMFVEVNTHARPKYQHRYGHRCSQLVT
jgi:hypothetical protein